MMRRMRPSALRLPTVRKQTAALILSSILTTVCYAQPKYAYLGAGACASSNCHGGAAPVDPKVTRILANEFRTWQLLDKHSTAYKVLSQPRSKRMAEILKIADATTDARCLVCHAAGSPDKSRADGVSCEACHGPAEKWLGTHTQANSHSASVAVGMIDTKDLKIRADTCLECHLGAGKRQVDHELIAAGHPDLAFELDTFTWAQPSHHRPKPPENGNALPRARAWAVGQARALADGMQLLETHAASAWPEFSDLECSQCHHDLRADSWRIRRGYDGRPPGSLQANAARYEVMRELVAAAAPDSRASLDSAFSRVDSLVSSKLTDGQAIGQAARNVSQLAAALADQFNGYNFTAETVQSVLERIQNDIQRIANAGENSAEQATMTLDALGAALRNPESPIPEPITALYNYLEHPSTYQPAQFVALYKKAAASLR
jgi:hypothetical protein